MVDYKACIISLANSAVTTYSSPGPKRYVDPENPSIYYGLVDPQKAPEVYGAWLRYMIQRDSTFVGMMTLGTVTTDATMQGWLSSDMTTARKVLFLTQCIIGLNATFIASSQFTLSTALTSLKVTMSNGGDNPSGQPPDRPSCV